MSDDLKAQYTEGRADGIYGWVLPADEPSDGIAVPLCVFVTHAYYDYNLKVWRPKARAGIYDLQRGIHHLGGHEGKPLVEIETFEVLGIAGHSGILFGHWGSFGRDSDGCFCFGKKIVKTAADSADLDQPGEMVTESRATFAAYMENRKGIDRFKLIVEELFPSGG